MDRATLRWLAVVPSAVVVYVVVFFGSFELLDITLGFCPSNDLVSGDCAAPWYRDVERGIICFGAASAAFLMVVVPARVAPSHGTSVARGIFVVGTAIALFAAFVAHAYLEALSAIVAGLLGRYVITSRKRAHDA